MVCIRRSLLQALLLLPAVARADPLEIDVEHIGPRWAGVHYQDKLGWFVQAPGDIDGDGRADFAVASPQNEGPVTFDSVVRVYLGRQGSAPGQEFADWNDTAFTDAESQENAIFQFSFVPDATGDGEMDLLVAQPITGNAGRVLLIPGPVSDWGETALSAHAVAEWTGFIQDDVPLLPPETAPSLVGGGDFDGDGLTDVVIASGLYQHVWIDMADDGFAPTTALSALPQIEHCAADYPESSFAAALATGDWNDDGRDDLAVGGPGCNGGEGEVYLWYGSAAGLGEAPDLVIGGGDRLGAALHTVDIDADGVDDLAIHELLSEEEDDVTREGRGGLWLLFGGAGGIVPGDRVEILGEFVDRRFGETVAVLPDISNPPDGMPELIVGSPEAAYEEVGRGAIYVFDGQDWDEDLRSGDAHWVVPGQDRDAWFGAALATLPDWDGDGRPEIVVGEPNYTAGSSENEFRRGRIYLMNALPDRDSDADGHSTLAGDCDDTDAAIHPGVFEECNGYDDDCDHTIDEGCGDDDDDDDDDDSTPPAGDDDTAPADGDCNCAHGPGRAPVLSLVASLALLLRRRPKNARPDRQGAV
jgi:hypothetical protein